MDLHGNLNILRPGLLELYVVYAVWQGHVELWQDRVEAGSFEASWQGIKRPSPREVQTELGVIIGLVDALAVSGLRL